MSSDTFGCCFRCLTYGVPIGVVFPPRGRVKLRDYVCVLCAKDVLGPPPLVGHIQWELVLRQLGSLLGPPFPVQSWHWQMFPGETYWTDG